MKKEIYINESMGETRIAIMEDGQLVEVYIEKQDKHRMVGNVYRGVVENVLPGMQAAFVDIGYEINAFLPFTEIQNDEYLDDDDLKENDKKNNRNNGSIKVDLSTGQEIYVQVIKEPFAGKGPRVTTGIALPGRLLVLVPNSKCLIIRTVAEGKSEEQINNDYQNLIKKWKTVERKVKNTKAPAIVYEDLETASSVIRDLFSPDVEKIVIDSKKLYRKTQTYLDEVSPNMASRLDYYKLKTPIFEGMGIEDEIAKLLRPKVWLKSGAYLIIEKTEAMVVVDVNSGRYVGKKAHEDNSLKINLEERIRLSLIDSMSDECPTCHGAGKIISIETLITRIDHWVRRYKSKFRNLRLRLDLHPENADFLIKNKKKVLRGLMWKNFVHISIESNVSIKRDQYRFFNVKDGKDVTNKVDIV